MVDRLNTFMLGIVARAQREEGQAIAEYALILALIAVVAAVVLGTLGTGIAGKLGDVVTAIG
jgi:pilus assembly protein Flp/PilA